MADDEWYYLQDGQSHGPESADALVERHHRGEVSTGTLVWRVGQEKWLPLGEAFPDLATAAPATSDASRTWTDTSAHPWRRYFARMFDSVTNGSLVLFAAAVGLALVDPSADDALATALDNRVLSSIAITLLAIPLNALLIGLTGGSLGKWLFGVRVLASDNTPIGFKEALSREGAVWVRGLGLGIPIVILITCIAGYNTLKKTGATSWDRARGLKVVHRPMGSGQILATAVGLASLVCVVVGLNVLGSLE